LDTLHQGLISSNSASLISGAIETITNINATSSAMWPLHGEKGVVDMDIFGYFWRIVMACLD
jgi:hypothetical protein